MGRNIPPGTLEIDIVSMQAPVLLSLALVTAAMQRTF